MEHLPHYGVVNRSSSGAAAVVSTQPATFYFDLGSPYSYLAAERINSLFEDPPEWQPVLLGALFKLHDRDSWANGPGREDGIREVEHRAVEYGLPEIRWPDPWPGNTLMAMRAATYAKQIGKVVSFSLAGFRQAFAAGRDLTDPDNVMLAAAACELHPNALTKAVQMQNVKDELREATEKAASLGVVGVPTVVVGETAYWGDDKLEEAAGVARRS
jgi:2-hydroxychromene-2-carboxylate isomerase